MLDTSTSNKLTEVKSLAKSWHGWLIDHDVKVPERR